MNHVLRLQAVALAFWQGGASAQQVTLDRWSELSAATEPTQFDFAVRG